MISRKILKKYSPAFWDFHNNKMGFPSYACKMVEKLDIQKMLVFFQNIRILFKADELYH